MNTSIIYILEIYLISRKGRTRMRYLQLNGSKSRNFNNSTSVQQLNMAEMKMGTPAEISTR